MAQDLSNINHYIHYLTRKVLLEMPKNPVFKEFLANQEMDLNALGRSAITRIIAMPNTIFENEDYQKVFIDRFLEHFGRIDDQALFLGKVNELLPDKKGKFSPEGEYLLYESSHFVSQAIEKHHLNQEINRQATVSTPTRIAQLRDALANNQLTLAQGRDGKFNILITQLELTRALESPQVRQTLVSKLSGQVHAFNQLPQRQNLPETERHLLPVVAKAGSQASASVLATLNSQLILKQSLEHYAFLRQQNYRAATQMIVDLQTQNISAQFIDQTGRKLLMRMNLLAAQNTHQPIYNLTFLDGPNARQTVSLTPDEIRKYQQQGFNTDQIFADKSEQQAAQQAADAQKQRLQEATQGFHLQDQAGKFISTADAGNSAKDILEGLSEAPPIETITPGVRITTPKKPVVSTTVRLRKPSQQNIAQSQKQLRDSRLTLQTPVIGALDAKKQREKRRQNILSRPGPYQKSSKPAGPTGAMIPKAFSQQLAVPTPKPSRAGRWTGGLLGGGITGLFAGASFFDIFF